MRNGTTTSNGHHVLDRTLAAMEEMKLYCAAHPGSPAAIRRPRLSIRGRTVVALLGPAIEEGIAASATALAPRCALLTRNTRALRPPSDLD
jgi:hypothetical protein